MGVAFLAMGEAVGIMMGHILGAGELDDAMKKAYRNTGIKALQSIHRLVNSLTL